MVKYKGTKHTLITGDCLEMMKTFPENSVDLIITDPPYNKGLDYGSYYKDNVPKKEFFKNAEIWLNRVSRVLSKTGSIYIITYPEIASRYLVYLEDECGLKLNRWLTWQYPSNVGHSPKNFTRTQRTILYMVKDKEKYTFNKKLILQPYKNLNVAKIKKRIEIGCIGRGSYDVLTDKDIEEIANTWPDVLRVNLLKNVSKERFTISKVEKGKGHPCQLPPLLIKILIGLSSKPGDTILDPFAGTFMVNKVAADIKRNSIGIEINPRYVTLGLKRLKNEKRSN